MITKLDNLNMNENVRSIFSPIKDIPISVFTFDEIELENISAEEIEERIQQDIQEILADTESSAADYMDDFSSVTSPYIYGVLFMIYAVAILRVHNT